MVADRQEFDLASAVGYEPVDGPEFGEDVLEPVYQAGYGASGNVAGEDSVPLAEGAAFGDERHVKPESVAGHSVPVELAVVLVVEGCPGHAAITVSGLVTVSDRAIMVWRDPLSDRGSEPVSSSSKSSVRARALSERYGQSTTGTFRDGRVSIRYHGSASTILGA